MKRLFLLVFSLVLSTTLPAKVLRVNNVASMVAGVDGHTTITSAVAAASSGDTIHIEGSVTAYAGATIAKKLVIIGPGYFLGNTAETQYNKESAKINGNITFAPGSDGSILAGIEQQSAVASVYSVPVTTYGSNNKVIIQANDIHIISCKLFYVEIYNTPILTGTPNNPTGNIENVFIQKCFFNPGVVADSKGAGIISNVTISNCFFRNDHADLSVVIGTTGKQSGWRISNCTFYNSFKITAENTAFTSNLFYYTVAASGVITTNTASTMGYNVTRLAFSTTPASALYTAGTNNIIDGTADEALWFSKIGNNPQYGIYFTAANQSTACPMRDVNYPADDTKQKGMYGGGAPYIPSGMFKIPSVYDIQMSNEVGDQFDMVIKAKTH